MTMFEGKILITIDNADGYTIYGPWMPRQADNVIMTLDYIEASAIVPKITVGLRTKNSEDPDDGSAVAGFSIVGSATGRTPGTAIGGLEELVRFTFTIQKNTTGGSAGDWAIFRMLSPVWFDAVEA